MHPSISHSENYPGLFLRTPLRQHTRSSAFGHAHPVGLLHAFARAPAFPLFLLYKMTAVADYCDVPRHGLHHSRQYVKHFWLRLNSWNIPIYLSLFYVTFCMCLLTNKSAYNMLTGEEMRHRFKKRADCGEVY